MTAWTVSATETTVGMMVATATVTMLATPPKVPRNRAAKVPLTLQRNQARKALERAQRAAKARRDRKDQAQRRDRKDPKVPHPKERVAVIFHIHVLHTALVPRREARRDHLTFLHALFLATIMTIPQEAEARRVEAEARRVEVEARRVEAEARRVEAEARRVEAEARRAEVVDLWITLTPITLTAAI